ncbi:MAG: ferritin-like domain-containing protein [Labilithrix sp.]|nr:ferritin-like domain-containing protein [Labilithrix sp.]
MDAENANAARAGVDTELFDLDVCTGTEHRKLEGVTGSADHGPASGAVDYMELRIEHRIDYTFLPEPTVIAKHGSPCASGPQKSKCESALAALWSTEGWPGPPNDPGPPLYLYLIWTKLDEVGTVTSLESLRDFVGDVENVKDAALLATASGTYRFVCDGTMNARKTETGWSLRVQTGSGCGRGADIEEHVLDVSRDGAVTVAGPKVVAEGNPDCTFGRRPNGLSSSGAAHGCEDTSPPMGRFFAEAAHLEAASIVAFAYLARELSALGAPKELVDSALASRDDEIRHARMTAKVATRHGGHPTAPEIAPIAERTALEIALENAVEGCVRETYSALVAHHQAQAAADPSIKAMMRIIAEDETRHAGLAWDVAAWLEPQLAPDERRAVANARARAVADLRATLASEPAAALVDAAGGPPSARALAMLDALDAQFIETALATTA